MEHYFIFVSKVDIQHFALRVSISIIIMTIRITWHLCYYATYPPTLVCHQYKHTTHHTNDAYTLHVTHTIHASMSSGLFLKVVRKFSPLKNCYFRNFDVFFTKKPLSSRGIYKFVLYFIQNLEHVYGCHHEHYCISIT